MDEKEHEHLFTDICTVKEFYTGWFGIKLMATPGEELRLDKEMELPSSYKVTKVGDKTFEGAAKIWSQWGLLLFVSIRKAYKNLSLSFSFKPLGSPYP